MKKKLEIVIAGTGPGLDTADWSKLPLARIAVNYAAHVVPGVSFIAALDRKVLTHNVMLFYGNNLITTAHTVDVMKVHGLIMPVNAKVNIVPYCQYSAHAAVKFAIMSGADHIIFVGMDGGSKRAKSIAKYYDETGREEENNRTHHQVMVEEMEKAGVSWEGLKR
jgi:hypothetical protein